VSSGHCFGTIVIVCRSSHLHVNSLLLVELVCLSSTYHRNPAGKDRASLLAVVTSAVRFLSIAIIVMRHRRLNWKDHAVLLNILFKLSCFHVCIVYLIGLSRIWLCLSLTILTCHLSWICVALLA